MNWLEESVQLERELSSLREVINAHNAHENWFELFSHLSKRVRDLYIHLYWPTLLDNTDVQAKNDFQQMVSTVYPRLEVLVEECLEAAANHPSPPTGGINDFIVGIWRSQRRFANPKTAELQGQEQSLVAEYHKILSELRIQSPTGPLTLVQSLNRRKRSRDPDERLRLWKLEAEARFSVCNKVDEIALQLVRIRQQIALQSGFGGYAEYVFNRERRFDFNPPELLNAIRLIRLACDPLNRDFTRYKTELLGADQPYPWDSDSEIQLTTGAPSSLDESTLVSAVKNAIRGIDNEFGIIVGDLFDRKAADLWQRPGKRPGAWSTFFSTNSLAVLSTNNIGIPSDFILTLHELGHCIHFTLGTRDKAYWLHQCSNDINEYAAYTIQCLATRELSNLSILQPVELAEVNLNTLLLALKYINDLEDQERFTHWVFSQDVNALTPEDLDYAYLEFTQKDGLLWAGNHDIKQKMWHTHRFIPRPFYSSEYILAWLMTMLALEMIDQERSTGLAKLKQTLTHNELGLKGVLSVWGISFPFDIATLARLSDRLKSEFWIRKP